MKTNYGIKLQERNGWFQFLYTVPKGKEFRFNGKKQVRVSLGTKDREEALEKRIALSKQFDARAWAEDIADFSPVAGKAAAANMNVPLIEAREVQKAPMPERIELLSTTFEAMKRITPNMTEGAVLVGAIKPPALPLSQAFERFKQNNLDKVKGKTEKRAKYFWDRYFLPVREFIALMGDMDVAEITTNDVKKYRKDVKARLDAGIFKSNEANKKLNWIKIILADVFYEDYDNKPNPFASFKKFTDYDDDAARPPFTPEEIKHVREAVLKSLISDEAKAIICIGEHTGANAKELALMEAGDIHLDAPIPFIQIRPNGLRGKVKKGGDRHRDIPLVGDAIEAMRRFPKGFVSLHYDGGPDNLNNALSDFFRKATPGKGFSSYRHTMSDWLRNSKCNDTLKNSILGHKTKGLGHSMHYGAGYELENKKEAIENALNYGNEKIAKLKLKTKSTNTDMTEVTDGQ